ncbi:hypothetical protein VC83_03297 [Pseudogymnoascus destructans]|nr:uncharacterized protein VC83_03297 [Pseudogymnoascus destructans]OAF60566.1 hypothetical protein VC83_03297 [Pseudogymnoascus destructans]
MRGTCRSLQFAVRTKYPDTRSGYISGGFEGPAKPARAKTPSREGGQAAAKEPRPEAAKSPSRHGPRPPAEKGPSSSHGQDPKQPSGQAGTGPRPQPERRGQAGTGPRPQPAKWTAMTPSSHSPKTPR